MCGAGRGKIMVKQKKTKQNKINAAICIHFWSWVKGTQELYYYCNLSINPKLCQNKEWQKVELGVQGHSKLLWQHPTNAEGKATQKCASSACLCSMEPPRLCYLLYSWLNTSGTYSQYVGGLFWERQRKTTFVKMKAFI